jgi:hypothetical protein
MLALLIVSMIPLLLKFNSMAQKGSTESPLRFLQRESERERARERERESKRERASERD